MTSASISEIGAGSAAQCSERILSALRRKNLPKLKRELARTGRICQALATGGSTLAEEQAELLEEIVFSLGLSISGHRRCSEAEVSLLGHLAQA